MTPGTPPEPDRSAAPLWHGRFDDGPADELWEYTLSLPFDQRLHPFDIAGCVAHAEGLGQVGLLDPDELEAVTSALETTRRELDERRFDFAPTDEDIHTAIERRVTELAGAAGAKLHTGRSRNDQVATAFRLFVRHANADVARRLVALQQVLVDLAERAGDTYLPGYTHLQQAQPVLLSHHFLAHFWALSRDMSRLVDGNRRADVSPLGAGALAGSSLPLDPASTATRLGFSRAFDNSLDAVSDRDFVAESLFTMALIGVHLSRIGEEIVVWSSEEFGFVSLDDAYSTGSSMLPQKKNPDIAELARGKTGRVIGNLTALLVTLKGLPLAYNRDLQEDKEPFFDSYDQIRRGLPAVAGMLATMTVRPDVMAASADSPFGVATDLAEFLVRGGMPFRDAHAVVGELVRRALAEDRSLLDLAAADPRLGNEAAALGKPGVPVTMRTTPGGAGPRPVQNQLVSARRQLESDRSDADGLGAGEPTGR